ncbi:MAG: hypothetical protein HFE63_01385 [Clostridiales bacterium]|nr:hypothetical protein [Clostridiales bacterium]
MPNITFTYGAGLNDSIFGKCQAPISKFIEKRGEAFEEASLVKEIFNVQKSNHFGEKFTSMTAMEGFQPVGEMGKHPYDGMQESYSKFIENETWKDQFSISREAIEDSKLMDLRQKPQAFVTGYYRTREKFAAAMLASAVKLEEKCSFSGRSFDVTCADSKKLFAADHPSKVGKAVQCNLFKDAFSANALGALETAMQNFKGDNGEILDISPTTIVIPNDYVLKQQVFEAIGSDKDPETSNNGFNYHYGRWNIIVHPYLNQYISGDIKPWILLDKNANETYNGGVWLDRTALEVTSSVDGDTNANIWRGYARFTAGFNDWRPFAVGGIASGKQLIG